MRLLEETPDESLWRGDILRLVDDYDRGPGSGPVDLMVFDPYQDGRGLGVVVASGYKAGAILSVFPEESCAPGKRSLETAWLLRHWNEWFCYTYEQDPSGNLVPLPLGGTQILAWDEREIVVKT